MVEIPRDPIEFQVSRENDDFLEPGDIEGEHADSGPAHASPARVDSSVDRVDSAALTQSIVAAEEPTADERRTADRELRELAESWDERAASFDTMAGGGVAVEQRSLLVDSIRRFMENRIAIAALVAMVMMTGLAIFAPMSIKPQSQAPKSALGDKGSPGYVNLPFDRVLILSEFESTFNFPEANGRPNLEHPFGTDNRGRDMWGRVWIGARISLAIAFTVALTILAIGVIYGAISGFIGGKLDSGMMRLLDALYGLPYVPFAIILVTVIRSRWPDASPLAYMVPALSMTTWFTAARIMRSQVLSLKNNEYVESATSSGARWYRIVGRHIVPNTIGIMVVAIFLEVPNAILGEATLSFLGLGVQLPSVSWGILANEGFRDFRSNPHLVWIPGGLIAMTVLCSIAVADGLRDALDPRGKR